MIDQQGNIITVGASVLIQAGDHADAIACVSMLTEGDGIAVIHAAIECEDHSMIGTMISPADVVVLDAAQVVEANRLGAID